MTTDKELERKMLEEVALRNAVAMFRRKNAALTGKSSTPEVGIFWIDDFGKMFAASVSLPEAEDYGEFKIFEKGHLEIWDAAIRANPKWRHLEYAEVPRGRVVYRHTPKKPEFIVYMPRRIGKYAVIPPYEHLAGCVHGCGPLVDLEYPHTSSCYL